MEVTLFVYLQRDTMNNEEKREFQPWCTGSGGAGGVMKVGKQSLARGQWFGILTQAYLPHMFTCLCLPNCVATCSNSLQKTWKNEITFERNTRVQIDLESYPKRRGNKPDNVREFSDICYDNISDVFHWKWPSLGKVHVISQWHHSNGVIISGTEREKRESYLYANLPCLAQGPMSKYLNHWEISQGQATLAGTLTLQRNVGDLNQKFYCTLVIFYSTKLPCIPLQYEAFR